MFRQLTLFSRRSFGTSTTLRMAPSTVAVIGSLMVDHIVITNRIPDRGETYPGNSYHKALGGKGANAAISAYRTCHYKPLRADDDTNVRASEASEVAVRMVGALGNDEYADLFKQQLGLDGIDTSGVRIVDGKSTAMTFIMVEEDSRDNRILSISGAGDVWSAKDFETPESLGNGVRPDLIISQLEISMQAVEQMLETAGKAGIDVLLNAAPANNILLEHYKYIKHLLVNESEAAILSGLDLTEVNENTWAEIAQGFLDLGVENVAITLGANGAFYANSEGSGHVPAFEVVPVDPTGAGDTFTGAYASQYLTQRKLGLAFDIKSAVEHACKAAALTVSTLGAQEGIPWVDEIEAFAATNPKRVVLHASSQEEEIPQVQPDVQDEQVK